MGEKESFKIVMAGGAGDMARVSARMMLALLDDCRIVIADLDAAKAERVAKLYGTPQVTACHIDIFDPSLMRETIRGADLVVNATGPLFRTGRPVLEACIDEKVNYMDYGDTYEASEDMLRLDERAKGAGISAVMCCGSVPGLASVLVRALVQRLDRAENIDIAWMTGGTPQRGEVERGGRALTEHMLFESTGTCKILKDGPHLQGGLRIFGIPSGRVHPWGRGWRRIGR